MTSADGRLRVAIVGPHAPYRGGIAHFTERISKEFDANDIQIIRVSFSRLYPEFLFPGKTQFEPGTDKNWSAAWTKSGNELPVRILIDSLNPFSWIAAARVLREANIQAALFMYWMPFFAPAYSTIARILQKAGIRTLAIVHNALPHERHIGDELLSDVFFSRCDGVCALSDSVAGDLKKMTSGHKAVVIQHPVYDGFGDLIDRPEARRQLEIDPGARVLLFFGLIRKYKGLDILLDALSLVRARIPDIKLIIAGEFYDEIEPYREQIAKNNLSDSVILMDRYIEAELVPVLFSAADVVVQPYRSATQSGVVQIAIHFERPSIVTNVGGLSELIGANGAGLVVAAENIGELADAIEHFFSDGVDERLTSGTRRLKNTSSWTEFVSFVKREIDRN